MKIKRVDDYCFVFAETRLDFGFRMACLNRLATPPTGNHREFVSYYFRTPTRVFANFAARAEMSLKTVRPSY